MSASFDEISSKGSDRERTYVMQDLRSVLREIVSSLQMLKSRVIGDIRYRLYIFRLRTIHVVSLSIMFGKHWSNNKQIIPLRGITLGRRFTNVGQRCVLV